MREDDLRSTVEAQAARMAELEARTAELEARTIELETASAFDRQVRETLDEVVREFAERVEALERRVVELSEPSAD